MDDKLSLLICGTQVSNSGFQELVRVGSTPVKKDYEYDNQFSTSDYYIECVHSKDFISYSMCLNLKKVKSADIPREGRLSIVVTIDRKARLDEGRSPFDLLMAVWEKFRTECMTHGYDGKYVFKSGKYSPETFEALLKNCPTKPYSGKYVEMPGSEPACLVLPSEIQLGQLLNDTQYSELSAYSSLRVAPKGNAQRPISLEIPRTPRFSVFVNGNKRGEISPNDRFRQTINPPEPQFEKETVLDFTLAELRQNKFIPGCKCSVDESREEIRCSVSFAAKCFRRKIRFEFDGVANDAMAVAELSQFVLKKNTGGLASSAKNITKDSNNELFVDFYGREVVDSWQCVYLGEKYKAPEYIHNPDISKLEAIDTIILSHKSIIRGFRIENLPNELMSSVMSVSCELNYRGKHEKNFDVAKGCCCTFDDVFNEITKESVKQVVVRFNGYEPLVISAASLRPDGEWLGVDAGGLRKKTPPVDNNRQEVQNPEQRCLLIKGIDRVDSKFGRIKITVSFTLLGKSDFCEDIRYIYGGEYSSPKDLRIVLPPKADLQKVVLSSENMLDKRFGQGQINHKDNEYWFSLPDLKPCTTWDKFRRWADRHQLFEKTMILIIGLALGVAGCYFISNFVEIKTDSKASGRTEEPPTMSTEQFFAASGGVEANQGGQSIDTTQQVKSTPKPADTPTEFPEVQQQVTRYYEKMKTANVRFDEANAIYKYVTDEKTNNAPNISKIRLMAKCYKEAAVEIDKIKNKDTKDTTAVIRRIFQDARTRNIKSDMTKFREQIQTLFLRPTDNPSQYDDYYFAVYYDFIEKPIADAQSFNDLIKMRLQWYEHKQPK